MNKKIKIAIAAVLIIIALILIVLNTIKDDSIVQIPTSDKTWSENTIFTNPEYQANQIEDIRNEYYAFDYNYTQDDPYIKINPFSVNPLSAYVIFQSVEPVKYSYSVHSKGEENNFEYNNEEFNETVVIPVIGLFENIDNTVTISTENELGEIKTSDIIIHTDKATYNPVETKVQTELTDEVKKGWYFDSFYNAYDIEGNIRYNLNVGVEDNYMKFNSGSFYVKVDNYQTIYEIDIMGRILRTFKTPSSEYNFHHDLVNASNGYVYALGSYNVELPNIPYAESLIFKYDNSSDYPIETYDIYDIFNDNLVSSYGTPNTNDPIHLNSIDYISQTNELIVSSQAQSFIAALNADDGSLIWVIQNSEGNIENPDLALTVIDEETFEETSGQHTAFVNNNSKYSEYTEAGDVVISIFNNNNCKDKDGNLIFKNYSDPIDQSVCTYDTSDVLIYAINETDRTVEQIDSFTIDDQYASVMSSVFNTPSDNFIVHYNQGSKPKSYLIDNNGNVLIEFDIEDYSGNGYYRTNFKNYSEITTMLDYA